MKPFVYFLIMFGCFVIQAIGQNPKNALPGNSQNENVNPQNLGGRTLDANNFQDNKSVPNNSNTGRGYTKPNGGRGNSNITSISNGPRGTNNSNSTNNASNNLSSPRPSFNLPLFILTSPFAINNSQMSFSENNTTNTEVNRNENKCSSSRLYMSAAVNASIPLYKFNVDHEQTNGFAKTGINVELDLHYYFLKRFNTGITFSLHKNAYSNPNYEPYIESRIPLSATNVKTEYNPWDSYNIMWSLGYSQPIWRNIAINFRGNIGLNVSEFPKAMINYNDANAAITRNYGATGLGLIYGGGLAVNYYFSPCFAAFINAYGYYSKTSFQGLNEKIFNNGSLLREERISEPFKIDHTWLVVGGGIKFSLGK